jgi:hypothetical protein
MSTGRAQTSAGNKDTRVSSISLLITLPMRYAFPNNLAVAVVLAGNFPSHQLQDYKWCTIVVVWQKCVEAAFQLPFRPCPL